MGKKNKKHKHERGKRSRPLTLTQLVSQIAACTAHRPERLAALALQFGHLAAARQQARDVRREQRAHRKQAIAEQPVQQLAQSNAAQAELELAANRRAMDLAHIAVSLRLCDFPPEWADLLQSAATDPRRVASDLVAALRVRQ